MITVTAAQHVYTNVEKEQSPRNRGGLQTLFHTVAALTEAEVDEMEARLVYFPSESDPVKRLFFTTSSRKVVVAQIVSLPKNDGTGRKGRYLAHGLVVAPEAFEQIGANPFRVFQHAPFITTVAEALDRGNAQNGDIPFLSLEIPTGEMENEIDSVQRWSEQELKSLLLIGLRADEFARERMTVAVIGDPAEAQSTIEAMYLALPVSLRSRCSFDTYFYQCNPVATYYWAVGLPERPNSPKYLFMDARSRRVLSDMQGKPVSTFERWVMNIIDSGSVNHLLRQKEHAFALGEWLDGRTSNASLATAGPREVIESIFQANPARVQERLLDSLKGYLPPRLARRVARQIQQRDTVVELMEQLRNGFGFCRLAGLLYADYSAEGFHAPDREEIQELGMSVRRMDHGGLRLLHACWMGDRRQVSFELGLLTEDEYRHALRMAMRSGFEDPLFLLIPPRGEAFLDVYLGSEFESEWDFAGLAGKLVEIGAADCLPRLLPYLLKQPAKVLRALEKLVHRYPHLPEPFQYAVREATARLPCPDGLATSLRRLLGFRNEKKDVQGKK